MAYIGLFSGQRIWPGQVNKAVNSEPWIRIEVSDKGKWRTKSVKSNFKFMQIQGNVNIKS